MKSLSQVLMNDNGGTMKPNDVSQQSEDYKRIEKAIQFIEANFQSQPTLEQIAETAGR